MSKITAAITAVGGYVPDFVLSNKVLETMVDTNDEWITTRTGIKERRILKGEGLGTSYLAIEAAKDLLKKGEYEKAGVLCKKVNDAVNSPETSAMVGICYELVGNYPKANEYYKPFNDFHVKTRMKKSMKLLEKKC